MTVIGQVVLTSELDYQGRPVGTSQTFRPDQTIICWLSTVGTDGLVGMRWYYGVQLIFEQFKQTQQNQFYTYIQSNIFVAMPDGAYRVEVYTTPEQLVRTVHFEVKRPRPVLVPAPVVPVGHVDLEDSPYPTAPFAFDERWWVDGVEWAINEVKVLFFRPDEVFVNIVAQTELNPGKLTPKQARRLMRPLAVYGLAQGYVQQARELQIDKRWHDLNEELAVTLVNRQAGLIPGVGQVPLYRLMFSLPDLEVVVG